MKKMLTIMAVALSIFFMYSCGDDDFGAKDVTGKWKTANAKLTKNTCDLQGEQVTGLQEEAYMLIENPSGDMLKFLGCDNAECVKADADDFGEIKFAEKLSMDIMNEEMELDGMDCKVTFNAKNAIHFLSADSATFTVTFTTTPSGAGCEAAKTIISQVPEMQEMAKMLSGTCTTETSGDANKQ